MRTVDILDGLYEDEWEAHWDSIEKELDRKQWLNENITNHVDDVGCSGISIDDGWED